MATSAELTTCAGSDRARDGYDEDSPAYPWCYAPLLLKRLCAVRDTVVDINITMPRPHKARDDGSGRADPPRYRLT